MASSSNFLNKLVRFAHEKNAGPIHKVIAVNQDGAVELHDMDGLFAPHLFVIADDIRGIPPTVAPFPINPGWRPICDEARDGETWLLYEDGYVWSDEWNAEFGWWSIASEAEPTYFAPMPAVPGEG